MTLKSRQNFPPGKCQHFYVVHELRQKYSEKWLKKGRQKFSRENVEIFLGGPRTETKFVKVFARLRTAVLDISSLCLLQTSEKLPVVGTLSNQGHYINSYEWSNDNWQLTTWCRLRALLTWVTLYNYLITLHYFKPLIFLLICSGSIWNLFTLIVVLFASDFGREHLWITEWRQINVWLQYYYCENVE